MPRRVRRTKRPMKKRPIRRRRRVIRKRRNPGNFTRLGHNMTLPKYLMVRQVFDFQGYIPTGSTSGFFDIDANNSFTPMACTASASLGVGTDFTNANNNVGVLLAGSTLTTPSQNYNELSLVYPLHRVLRSAISISCIPQALTDSLQIYLTPYVVGYDAAISGTPQTGLPLNDTSQAFAPRCKTKQMVANLGSQSKNTIRDSIHISTLFGMSKRAILDDNTFAFNADTGAPLGSIGAWRIFYTTSDAQATAVQLPFHVRLIQVTKFEGKANTYQV